MELFLNTVGVSISPFSPSSRCLLLPRQGRTLDVACDEVLYALDLGDAASSLDRAYIIPEYPLTATSLDQRGSLGLSDRGIDADLDLDPSLPSLPFFDVPFGFGQVTFDLDDLVTNIGHTCLPCRCKGGN